MSMLETRSYDSFEGFDKARDELLSLKNEKDEISEKIGDFTTVIRAEISRLHKLEKNVKLFDEKCQKLGHILDSKCVLFDGFQIRIPNLFLRRVDFLGNTILKKIGKSGRRKHFFIGLKNKIKFVNNTFQSFLSLLRKTRLIYQ